ncbi:hypothetical protein AB1Y20_019313 [Prymnesium parvum]|uniref:Carotenoid oxygenase n=1 Tax=Prymnesium parvum TaxID=97485 RepID=A0AB34JQT6_PRYPA
MALVVPLLPTALFPRAVAHQRVPSPHRAAPPVACAELPLSDWRAAFHTQPEEFLSAAVRVRGAAPLELRAGVFYKNGPARFARGGTEYAHWLDGDGYVTSLRLLADGTALWSGRYVATEAYAAEAAADEVLLRTTFGTALPGGVARNCLRLRLKSPANTAVVAMPGSGALLALWEAGPPYELDAESLACRGPSDLGGRLALSPTHGALPATTQLPWLDALLERAGWLCDACAAHPRADPAGATVFWSWRQRLLGRPAIEVALHQLPHRPAPSGEACTRRAVLRDVPFAPHDMALGGRYAAFITCCTSVAILPFIAGLKGPAQCTTFDGAALAAGEGSKLHLIPRREADGSGAAVFNIGEPFHAVHHANAWESDLGHPLVHVVSTCWPPAAVRRMGRSGQDLLGSWAELRGGNFEGVPTTNLVWFTLNVSSGVVEHRILANGAQLDHPKVHPNWETRECRFVWATMGRRDDGGSDDATPSAPQSFACVDLHSNTVVDSWYAGRRRLVDEATIVPRLTYDDNRHCDGERDAWLIAPIFDGSTRKSTYVVLDAANLAAGPVCEVELPTFIPWGLHGSWVLDPK